MRQINKRFVQIQEMFLRNQRVIGLPFYVTLESGNSCNLRCPLCPTTFREKEIPKGMLTFENAKKIIDRFPALLLLSLSLWGEPFLNKEIFQIIKYARRRKIDVFIQSNFSLPQFNEQMAQNIIDSDLSELWLSIDGASQETYEVYRRRGDFGLVMRNLELLCRLKKEQHKQNPRITWKVVVNQFNQHEIGQAREMAERLGVDFRTVEIDTPDHLQGEWKPTSTAEQSSWENQTHRVGRCFQLWQVMTVNFNGDVFPCCGEWSPEDALGNVLRESVRQIWNSAVYRKRRANNKTGPAACSDCHTNKKTNYWRQWHPEEEEEKNTAMLPLPLVEHTST